MLLDRITKKRKNVNIYMKTISTNVTNPAFTCVLVETHRNEDMYII